MTIDRSALERAWLHSHEDDTADETVYRPADYAFPPSRGRQGFELRSDGSCLETAIGPTDRPQEATGTWELTDDDTLVLSRPGEPDQRWRVRDVTEDRLVVERA